MIIKRTGFLSVLIFLFLQGFTQVVVMSPQFATQQDFVTITFDATQGNGELAGQAVVYAHTGVITDKSSSGTDWKYVQGNWGTDDAKVKMTSLGNNKFSLSYQIASFYGVPSSEKVQKLAFVFRNQSGSLVGRNSDGSDIFVPVSSGGFQIIITAPASKNTILNLNDTLPIHAVTSSKASTLRILINDSVVKEVSNDSVIAYNAVATTIRDYTARVVALSGANTYQDSFRYTVRNPRIQASPPGIVDGINYLNDSTVVLQLFAPAKQFVYAIGDFNNWQFQSDFELIRTPDGQRYWIQLSHLVKQKEYTFQYAIDKEQIKVADPYSDVLLDPYNDGSIPAETYPNLVPYPKGKTTEYVSVLQTGQSPYVWKHSSGYVKPDKARLHIYELLIRDFTGKRNYKALSDTLDYLQSLGINAIELMPFNEFEGNESWGYNTAFYFAPDKYYGTRAALKSLIDECHRRGMAVIMDMVLNHNFGQSSLVRMYFDVTTGKPSANSPWFNPDATHPYNVGYDFNHESVYTKALVDTVLRYWQREFRIDGFRFDLSKGFTQKKTGSDVGAWSAYDPSRVVIWKRIGDRFREQCTDCYMILEHFADNTEQTILSDYGFMLWGNMNSQYNEATMGYSSDLNGTNYKQFGWSSPNLIPYMESHDEERLQYKNVNYGYVGASYNAKDTATALSRNEAAAVIYFSVPGPKMVWQFGELGYDYSINYCTDGTINNACRLSNKPVRWDYRNQPNRNRVHDLYAAMMQLRNTETAFSTADFSTTLTGNYKVVRLNDSTMNVLVIANMGVVNNTQKPGFSHVGWWYDYFGGDSVFISQTDTSLTLKPAEYRVYTTRKLETPDITPTGLETALAGENSFEIYPNPAKDELYIRYDSRGYGETQLELTDLLGRSVYSGVCPAGKGTVKITLPFVAAGSYLLQLHNGPETSVHKLIITE